MEFAGEIVCLNWQIPDGPSHPAQFNNVRTPSELVTQLLRTIEDLYPVQIKEYTRRFENEQARRAAAAVSPLKLHVNPRSIEITHSITGDKRTVEPDFEVQSFLPININSYRDQTWSGNTDVPEMSEIDQNPFIGLNDCSKSSELRPWRLLGLQIFSDEALRTW